MLKNFTNRQHTTLLVQQAYIFPFSLFFAAFR